MRLRLLLKRTAPASQSEVKAPLESLRPLEGADTGVEGFAVSLEEA
jgi:hypothetical protein